jgi:hypothetical protein
MSKDLGSYMGEAVDADGGRIAMRIQTTLGLARVTSRRKRAD